MNRVVLHTTHIARWSTVRTPGKEPRPLQFFRAEEYLRHCSLYPQVWLQRYLQPCRNLNG